jgi:hypothetical protein
MSVIIFFSASKKKLFCRNDVQAIDFLRKGSYAPVNRHNITDILLKVTLNTINIIMLKHKYNTLKQIICLNLFLLGL